MSDPDIAWFHEDDYCEIEVLPKSAEAFARRQGQEIHEFSRAHEAPGGVGWTDIYVRQPPPATLADVAIRLDELAACAPPELKVFKHVMTGISSRGWPSPRTIAWGLDDRDFIFADFSEATLVLNIWLSLRFSPRTSQEVDLLVRFLLAAGQRWPLILAHWAWNQVVDLSDAPAVRSYLSQKM
jgi:hypothetical protein